MVRIAGLEPARLTALPPQSSVSANSTISASRLELKQLAARKQVDSGRFAPVGAICTPLPERGAPAPREPTQAENPQSRSSALLTLPASLDFCRLCVGGVSGCARATTMNRRRLQAETIARIPGPNNPSGAAQFLATHREPLRFGARSVPLRSACATTIALGPIHGASARVAAAA